MSFLRGLPSRPAAFQARMILGVVGVILLAYLALGDNPWDAKVVEGKRLKVSQYVAIYFWIAAAVNLVAVGVFAATASWWTRSMPPVKTVSVPAHTSVVFRFVVIAAMAAAAILAWPRLGQSFWHDESDRVEDVLVGKFKKEENGEWKFRSLSWRDTIFHYRVPNHVLQSILSRASNTVWQVAARPEGLRFSETAIRFPGYIAGILAVGALALLLARLGYAHAGILAAWLLALHPWFLRYATEARAYNYVLLFIPLYYLTIRAIWERGRTRDWVVFGTLEFFLMYVYPTSAFVLAATNILLMPILIARWKWSPALFVQGTRWFMANVAAALLFFQLMLPCIPQFLDYVEKTPGQGDLNMRWLKNVGAFFLTGMPWSYSFQPESAFLELWPWANRHPLLMSVIIWATAILLTIGLLRLICRSAPAALFAIALPLASLVCVLESKAREGYLFEWYIIFLLPAAVAFLAVGVWAICQVIRLQPLQTGVFAAISVVLLSLYVAWTQPQRSFLRDHSLQPYRESVAMTRPNLNPSDSVQDRTITATFYSKPFPYDPRIILFKSGQELGELVHEAEADRKDLYINLGFLVTVQGEHPHKYRFLKESGFFEDLGIIPGFMETLGRHVFRYRPGSAKSFDFSTIPRDIGRSDRDQKTPAVDIGGGKDYSPEEPEIPAES